MSNEPRVGDTVTIVGIVTEKDHRHFIMKVGNKVLSLGIDIEMTIKRNLQMGDSVIFTPDTGAARLGIITGIDGDRAWIKYENDGEITPSYSTRPLHQIRFAD